MNSNKIVNLSFYLWALNYITWETLSVRDSGLGSNGSYVGWSTATGERIDVCYEDWLSKKFILQENIGGVNAIKM